MIFYPSPVFRPPSGLSMWLIIGLLIGALLGLVFGVFIGFELFKRAGTWD